LWNQGNATYKLYAFAFDEEGNGASLGTKTITVDNAHADRPFGAIDTPGYGEITSGTTFVNFGWALTPVGSSSCKINPDGIQVGIDSGPLAPVMYGDPRPDIASSFPSFLNSANASGAAYVNTTLLSNGMHQIGWLVTDSCGRQDGVGSRFFNVLNGSADASAGGDALRPDGHRPVGAGPRARPDAGVTTGGYPYGRPNASDWDLPDQLAVRQLGGDWQTVTPSADGAYVIEVTQGGRIEVRLPRWDHMGPLKGFHIVADQRRLLPLGSSFDAKAGVFYWQPAAGFLGTYDLVFGAFGGDGAALGDAAAHDAAVRVRVVVGPSI
jgi:hypothetical protein